MYIIETFFSILKKKSLSDLIIGTEINVNKKVVLIDALMTEI